ncbi:tetratricopeptide repeat protein [SAR202 cluster bacterium AC-409-J13_OGT_754m]|nr:tetratricopeptide repeat protein [SAR202 cluster bacterium AC-409-J13_OGT_754m]
MNLITLIEDGSRIKKEKCKEAIQLALSGKWREAIPVNQMILAYFPEDTEALSRIGKAYLELGDYTKSRKNFQKVLEISPYNSIAKRNLNRLQRLPDTNGNVIKGREVRPQLFIEESGKSGITHLAQTAGEIVLAKIAAGDVVNMKLHDNKLAVLNQEGDRLGFVETRLGSRLVRLMKLGVLYDVAVLRVDGDNVTVIVRETFRDSSVLDTPSFPSIKPIDHGRNVVDSRRRYNIDNDLDDGYGDDSLGRWELNSYDPIQSNEGNAVSNSTSIEDEDEDEDEDI